MIQDNEVIALVLAMGVLLFLFLYRAELRRIPCIGVLLPGYLGLCLGLVSTVAEGFFWPELINFVEHLSRLASACFLVAWLWCVTRRGETGP